MILTTSDLELAVSPHTYTVHVTVDGHETPLLYPLAESLTLGRRDPNTGDAPDVDLRAYEAYRNGVSRRHAALRLNSDGQLELWDLGSQNGTYLNGRRLVAHRPYPLNDDDDLRLSNLHLRVSAAPSA